MEERADIPEAQERLLEEFPEEHREATRRLFEDPKFQRLVETASQPDVTDDDLREEAMSIAADLVRRQQLDRSEQ